MMRNTEDKKRIVHNSYRRQHTEVIAVYKGFDQLERPSLFVKLINEPKVNIETEILRTRVGYRNDGLWALEISLLDIKYQSVFNILVEDLIDEVKDEIRQQYAEKKLIKRYLEWVELFEENSKNTLSERNEKGLIGELYLLYYKFKPVFGIRNSILAWCGPEAANQDFHFKNTWFEVKSKSINSNKVTISNEFQLSKKNNGYLVVITMEKSTEINNNSLSLTQMVNKIIEKITDVDLKQMFVKKLAKLGFLFKKTEDENYFEVCDIDYYLIDDNFPKIKIPQDGSIINVKYDINLSKIIDTKRGEEEWKNIERNF